MNKLVLTSYFISLILVAHSQKADFSYSTTSGLFCNPSTVQFTQTSTGNPTGFVWNFGNGSGTNQANPNVTFNNAGSYDVKLIVIYGQTTSSITKTIVINPAITASIVADRNYICQPGDISLSAGGNGNINSYSWQFGDGSNIVTRNNSATHNFGSPGTYRVTLLATDVSGCFDTASTSIIVQPPSITGIATPSSGCVPVAVSFTANASIPINSSVSNYTWNFGDGSPPASTDANTTNHVYSITGNFSPTVTVTTTEGCTSNYTFQGIAYGTPPINLVAYPVLPVVCGSDTARFVSKATNANSYFWDFGDDSTLHLSDTIAGHKYNTLGIKDIKVTPSYGGCPGVSGSIQINVIGVIAKYTFSNTCADRKTFSFMNTSQGNLSTISWDFGDGSPVVNAINATHTFPGSGSFITKLTIKDTITGCTDRYSRIIYTADPILINQDSTICRNSTTTFSVINSFRNPLTLYAWNVVGRLTDNLKDSSYTLRAANFGNFSNYVIILNGSEYCYDTIRLNHNILVKGPDVSFSSPSAICLNSSYSVVNTSKPFVSADSITTWYWNFGITSINDSSYEPKPFLYTSAGSYNVELTGIDKNGCKDSVIKQVVVNPLPFLYVIPAVDTLCSGKADTLLAFHNGTVQWAPSNSLTCSTCDTVLTTASANTKYYITATSQFGCITNDSIIVKVYPPFTTVAAVSDVYICLNDTAHLDVDPLGKRIVWTPTVGLSDPNNYGPIVSPSQNTTYTATLTDSVGCFTSSTSINLHIKSLPTVDAGPDQFYAFNSSFTINPKYSNNVSLYNWTPGSLLSCTACPSPSGVATKSNTFYIEVTSDSGCIAKDSIRISIECKDSYLRMPNAFTPNNDHLNDYFYPLTIGVQSIIRFSIYDRFGHLVFEAKNFLPNNKAFGWDGRVQNQDQSTGVFVYYLEALCDSGEKLYKKGSVVLIR